MYCTYRTTQKLKRNGKYVTLLLKWRHPDERVITSGIIQHMTLRLYTKRLSQTVKGSYSIRIIQLSPLLECDPTVCLLEKSKVTQGIAQGWPNFSRGDKPSVHTPTRVIIGILYRIFLHQTTSNRIPAALQKYLIYRISYNRRPGGEYIFKIGGVN